MAHILAFTTQFAGHLFPFMPICHELQIRGHHVSIAVSTADELPVEFDGIRLIRVAWRAVTEVTRSGRRQPRFQRFNTPEYFADYGDGSADALTHLLEVEAPDFVLIDPKIWGGMVAAEASGVPWGTVAHNPLFFRGCGIDPRGPGWAPPKTWFDRLRQRFLNEVIHIETASQLAILNQVRSRHSLAPLARLTDLYVVPPLILATTTQPFEYPRTDWPTSLHFIGPMIYDSPNARDIDLRTSDSRPLVLLAGSTITTRGRYSSWADSILSALAAEPYRIVATLPTDSVQAFAPNLVREDVSAFSHTALLPHTSCVICHGGSGIVQKALWYGIPVVAVPFAHDRFEVARRVERSGAGVMLRLDKVTPSKVRKAVRQALGSKSGAQRVGFQFRQAGGPQAAADLVEAKLK